MSDLKFPIGKFEFAPGSSMEQKQAWINDIAETPANLRRAVSDLNDSQLDTPYRDGGWTVRQLVHHVADSHINSYVRFRLALTEQSPVIALYQEQAWAELEDAKRLPVDVSLMLLDALHLRWVVLLRSLDEPAFSRAFKHPEVGLVTVDRALQLYAWHGKHHVVHVTALRERKGW